MGSRVQRDAESQRAHDEAVRLIADHRFGLTDWSVGINPVAEQNHPIGDNGTPAYPDIVARCDDGIVAIGEVETSESISEEEAHQWRELARLCGRLYLFVPEGMEDEAARLIEDHQIHCAGLRTYSIKNSETVLIESVPMSNGRAKWNDHPWWTNLGKN
ncbi:MAG: hypothetical protein Q7N50_10085 [Armatimonadota bacterium]|nr:hypothetical protein [Armatimonadota bacterium]